MASLRIEECQPESRHRQWLKVLVTMACLSTFLPTYSPAQENRPPQNYRPQVGELHPDFTLPRLSDGKPVSLSDLRGKKVLLIQFASW